MAENTEKVVEKTESKAEFFKKFLTLEPWFINRFGPKLKPMAKWLYYALLVILVLKLLGVVVDLFRTGDVITFVVGTIVTAVFFIVARMFGEYLTNE